MNLFGKPNFGIGKGCFIISEFNCVHLYIHPCFFMKEHRCHFNFISQEMGLDRGAQDPFGWPLRVAFGNFEPSTTFNGWKPQTYQKEKSSSKPQFLYVHNQCSDFSGVYFSERTSHVQIVSASISCSRWWYCSTTFHIFGPEDFHPICLFLPTKPIIGGANIRCILVYPLPVLPDHEHPRVPCPTSPPG